MAETELKAFVLSQSSESSQESAGKTEQQNGGTVTHAKAPDSKLSAHILFSGTRSLAGIQQTSAGAEQQPAENKPLTDQVISGWKQMKYTPFGKTTGSFTIRLNPENLGFVTIKVTNENGMFQSKIIASSQSAKELLEQHLPQLKQSLPNMSVRSTVLQSRFKAGISSLFTGRRPITINSSIRDRESRRTSSSQAISEICWRSFLSMKWRKNS